MATVDLEAYKDLDRAIEQLLQCKPLSELEVKELCVKAQNVFVNENNVQPVAAPVTVRGERVSLPADAACTPLGKACPGSIVRVHGWTAWNFHPPFSLRLV
jgi:hypothetical protein